MSASREAFEKWYASMHADHKPRAFSPMGFQRNPFNTDEYRIGEIQQQWLAYQAAYLQGEAAGVRRAVDALESPGGTCFTCYKAHKDAIKAAFPQHFDSSSTS